MWARKFIIFVWVALVWLYVRPTDRPTDRPTSRHLTDLVNPWHASYCSSSSISSSPSCREQKLSLSSSSPLTRPLSPSPLHLLRLLVQMKLKHTDNAVRQATLHMITRNLHHIISCLAPGAGPLGPMDQSSLSLSLLLTLVIMSNPRHQLQDKNTWRGIQMKPCNIYYARPTSLK